MNTIRRAALGSAALLAVLGTAACAGPAAADTGGHQWYRPYVGTWSGHARQIVITADGTGTMDGRTYVTCGTDDEKAHPGVPCEQLGVPADVSVQSVRMTKASRVQLEITKTNDADRPVGRYRTALSHGDKVLTVTLVDGHGDPVDVTFCAPSLDDDTSRDVCG